MHGFPEDLLQFRGRVPALSTLSLEQTRGLRGGASQGKRVAGSLQQLHFASRYVRAPPSPPTTDLYSGHEFYVLCITESKQLRSQAGVLLGSAEELRIGGDFPTATQHLKGPPPHPLPRPLGPGDKSMEERACLERRSPRAQTGSPPSGTWTSSPRLLPEASGPC